MKKLFSFVFAMAIVVMIASIVFAEVTAEIMNKSVDNNAIVIWTKYKVDNKTVYSNYPAPGTPNRLSCPESLWNSTENKCSGWVTRYSVENFAGMNATQRRARIKKDIKAVQKNIIIQKYKSIANPALNLNGMIGETNTEESASIYVDNDQNGTVDTEWVVYTNGTKTEQPYTP